MDRILISAGRKPEESILLPVSKTKPVSDMEVLARYGITVFGENHVQEILRKKEEHPEYDFHMIGHLQRNKVRKLVGNVSLIHSVDSLALLTEIDRVSQMKNINSAVLLQVNTGNEESKSGFTFEEIPALLDKIGAFSGVTVKGLMAVAPKREDPEENRPLFRRMKELAVDINNKNIDNIKITILSMGMTDDFRIALQEGATLVRVGTAIFGERNYSEVK